MSNVSNEQMLDGDAGGSSYVAPADPVVAPVAKPLPGYGGPGPGVPPIPVIPPVPVVPIVPIIPKVPVVPIVPIIPKVPVVPPIDDNNTSEEKTNAFSRLKELLNRIGLSSLTSKVQDLIARGILDGDAIMFELRGTDEYQKRFIGNVARKANNLPELSPLVYVALEQKFRETLKANGLNADLYDKESDFVGLIEGDVSPGELQTRIEKGYRAVMDADPEVIRQMQELYKVSVADIAQFFLDPKKTAPELERKAQAAQVAARAKEQGKMQLTSITAEELVSRGYTESQAQQAFSMLSEGAGLYDEMAGEDALTQGQKIGSAFGYDTTSRQAIQKRAAVRKAAISSSSKFTSTTGATSGTTETGLNVAQ
jgi:hypothetical protein